MRVASALQVGDVIAQRYLVDELIGRGGMGMVYRARHKGTDRPVAIKRMLVHEHASTELVERFLREARLMGRIDHPSVVSVIDVGVEEGAAYIVMELLHGLSLRKLMRKQSRFEIVGALAILMPAMEGVHAAHLSGVVHRDIKPENFFVVMDGRNEPITTKVLDFGISKLIHSADEDTSPEGVLTRSGITMGTPRYMAPEQVLGGKTVGPGADIWALGTIIYEMIAGRAPYLVDGIGALGAAMATQKIPRLDALCPHVPTALADVIHRALEHDAAKRFPDVGAMAGALEPFANGVRFKTPRLAAARVVDETIPVDPATALYMIRSGANAASDDKPTVLRNVTPLDSEISTSVPDLASMISYGSIAATDAPARSVPPRSWFSTRVYALGLGAVMVAAVALAVGVHLSQREEDVRPQLVIAPRPPSETATPRPAAPAPREAPSAVAAPPLPGPSVVERVAVSPPADLVTAEPARAATLDEEVAANARVRRPARPVTGTAARARPARVRARAGALDRSEF